MHRLSLGWNGGVPFGLGLCIMGWGFKLVEGASGLRVGVFYRGFILISSQVMIRRLNLD